jgi:SNF2 family DNA or RNA helicase
LKPTIYLNIKENTAVLSNINMEIDFWKQNVCEWWKDSSIEIEDNSIAVELDKFLVRKGWFNSVWAPLGGDLDYDEETKFKLQRGIKEFEEFKSRLDGKITASKSPLSTYKRPLTNFQIENIKKLISMPSGANFSVPGAGKTTTTLALWNELKLRNKVGSLIVVCPRSAFESWQTEPAKNFNENINTKIFDDVVIDYDVDILIVNYEKLEKIDRTEAIIKWASKKNVHLVIDEAHRIKGGVKSIRWQRCKSIASISSRVDLLTGTPMPQGFDDLRNLFSLTWPNVPRNYLTDQRLQSIPNGSIFVRTTKNELKLPSATVQIHAISMGTIQTEIYQALRKKFSGLFRVSAKDESYFNAKGRAIMSLLAASSNPGLLAGINREDAYLGLEWPPKDISANSSLIQLVESYASHEIPTKYRWISEYVKKASESHKKVLVWSNLVGNILSLSRLLEPFNPAIIYGAVSNEDRVLQLEKFRNDDSCNVLITNPQTLGEGVSLHRDCHDAIYLDRSYNAGHYLQSLDRIHRLGLPENQETNIHILCASNSLDERIRVRLEQKIERLALSLNDSGLVNCSLPDETISLPNELLGIDSFDLNDLFAHLNEL